MDIRISWHDENIPFMHINVQGNIYEIAVGGLNIKTIKSKGLHHEKPHNKHVGKLVEICKIK